MENVTVRQLVDLLNKEENMIDGATGRERTLNLWVNGKFYGNVASAKLDGWGDGLITDVCLELTTEHDGDEQTMSENKGIKLLPCPFCGGEGAMRVNAQTLNCSVNCVECGVFMKRNFKGHKRVEEVLRELMARDWNRRIYER